MKGEKRTVGSGNLGSVKKIFVSVGTHSQPFDRLLRELDAIAARHRELEVFAQTGNSGYVPRNFRCERFLEDKEYGARMQWADVVLSHGGAGTIINALLGKKPLVVVPRLAKFGEHTNDHQLDLARALEEKGKAIAVFGIGDLEKNVLGAFSFRPGLESDRKRLVGRIASFLEAGKMSEGVNWGREKAVSRKKPVDSRPLVSVLLLNMNGKKLTRNCIDSVLRNTIYPGYEIVAVDNGSKDGSVEMLKEMQKKGVVKKLILNKENVGYSRSVNQGFGECNGKYVYHLDNDTLVEKNWLSKAVEAAEGLSGRAGAVGSVLVSRADYGKGLKGREIVRERLAVCGAAMMYSRKALKRVGLLDAELWSPIYGEEQDWCYRARNAGFRVVETNASRVYHIGGQDTTKSIKAIERYRLLERNRVRAMLYNLSIPEMASHVPGLGLIFVNSFGQGMTLHLLKTYTENIANWREVLRQREKRKTRLF